MESRNPILQELQSISPLVAGIVPVNPLEVPEGYFENFSSNMLQLVSESNISATLLNANSNPYSVPENYFNNFAEQMLVLVQEEKRSNIIGDNSTNPYVVPAGYFQDLTGQILSRVKAQDTNSAKEELELISPLLSKIDKKLPFSTPAGYFDDLAGTVIAGKQAIDFVNEELENLSPMMTGLKAQNVYQTPAGYFEALPGIVLDKARKGQPAKVVSMSFSRKLMRYAAAAVVIGILLTAGFLFVNRNAQDGAIVVAETEEKIQQETQTQVKDLSDEELSNFEETQATVIPDFLNIITSGEMDGEDIKVMLADIPDSELNQYLAEFSNDQQTLTN